MKYLFLFTLLFSFIAVQSQPTVHFENTNHDFGSIKEDGGVVENNFELTNQGNEPLIISNVRATCGCTTPSWTREPILPGQKGFVKVGYNPRNRPGAFTQRITVYSNTQPSVNVLTIRGTVSPRERTLEERFPREMGAIRLVTNFTSMGTILEKEIKTQELSYINTSDAPVTLGVHRSPSYIEADFEPKTVQPGKEGKILLTFNAAERNAYGLVSDRVYLTINEERQNTYSLGVSATIQEDFSHLSDDELNNAPVAVYDNTVFNFGTINQGERIRHDFKLSNEGKTDLIIRNLRTGCGCTAVKHDDVIKPGQSTNLTVEFNSRGKRNRQNQAITVITNDPKNPTTVLRLMGTVDAN